MAKQNYTTQQAQKNSPITAKLAGLTGKITSGVGKAVNNPSIQNFGNTMQSKAGYYLSQLPSPVTKAGATYTPPNLGTLNVDRSQFVPISQLNSGGSTGSYQPSTSGQSAGGDIGGGGEGYDYTSALRDAYNKSRSALESLLPTYDSDFNNYKTNVEGAITDAQNTLGTQKADVTKRYGDTLKNLLNTSRDLRQRTSSTFSGLGSLDSSAYGDELVKQEQADKEGIGNIDLAQNKDLTGLDETFSTYERDQRSKVNSYQTDIDRAKAGVRQAIANGDIEQAQTLATYAQQVEANMQNLRLSMAQSQAQGVDVLGALRKINGADFNNAFGQSLGNRYNSALSRYVIPSAGAQGQGYISSSGSADERKRLLGLA